MEEKKLVHKITFSLGSYDIYKLIRKNGWRNIGRPLTEKEFYSITRTINKLIAEELVSGKEIKLPYNLGTLCVFKEPRYIKYKEGKLKTNLPIDWIKTHKLWEEDAVCKKNKILVRYELNDLYKVIYFNSRNWFVNKSVIKFRANRNLKRALVRNIQEDKIEAFLNPLKNKINLLKLLKTVN